MSLRVSTGALALLALVTTAFPRCSRENITRSSQAGELNSAPWAPPPPASAPLPPAVAMTPLTTHPRLLVRDADLARLRAMAAPTNPVFASGLEVVAREYVQKMDKGEVAKDPGLASNYTGVPSEAIAELFAFVSLVHPDRSAREDYLKRAKTLLMSVIDKAAEGAAEKPFRSKDFSISDRSRWHGEGFALTVDWIYGSLSAGEKAKIRKVFLRWAEEIVHADKTTENHPEPIGVLNDTRLTSDRKRVRWAANNYYTGHLRNLGLMALVFDAADDPDEKLRAYLKNATGAWLYVSDALMRSDEAGGLAAEGFQYSPQAVGYVALFLTALHTAGKADPRTFGPQVTYENAFWHSVLPAHVHSLSPMPSVSKDSGFSYLGPLYSVAWFGDGEKFYAPDPMGIFGPMALYFQLIGDDRRFQQAKWVELNTAPGGAGGLGERAKDGNWFSGPILNFLLFDPKASPPPDPRPALPLTHFASGLGRILGRTSWGPDATWFTYKLGWSTIDHQHSDGNMFELYRKGEWLTKERTGYGSSVGCTDYKNSVAIQNDVPQHNEGYRGINYKRGSQWMHVNDGDGKLTTSFADKFIYALGDSTLLYNSTYERSTDVVHASRSIVWLKPDRIVTYDRAVTKTDKRFKRYWLNLPRTAKIEGQLATMTSEGGQKLYVRSLLPTPTTMTVEAAEALDSDGPEPAKLDPIRFRLRIEPPNGPKSTRFLTVLQGADGSGVADNATLVRSSSGTAFEGASVNDVVVIFPVDVGGAFASLTYSAPKTTKAHLVTGLTPDAPYAVTTDASGTVTVKPGGDKKADKGGVLVIGQLP